MTDHDPKHARSIFNTMTKEQARSVYRAALNLLITMGKIEDTPEDRSDFRAHVVALASTGPEYTGLPFWAHATSTILGQVEMAATVTTVQITQETLNWGGFLGGHTVNDTRKGEALVKTLVGCPA